MAAGAVSDLPELKTLTEWGNSLHWAEVTYAKAASGAVLGYQWLGGAVITVTTVVGTAIFASLETSPSDWAKVLFGSVSVIAAVLAAVQTFLGLDAKSDAYQRASDAYGALFREVEDLKDDLQRREDLKDDLQRRKDIDQQKGGILEKWNSARALVKRSAPDRYWKRARAELHRPTDGHQEPP